MAIRTTVFPNSRHKFRQTPDRRLRLGIGGIQGQRPIRTFQLLVYLPHHLLQPFTRRDIADDRPRLWVEIDASLRFGMGTDRAAFVIVAFQIPTAIPRRIIHNRPELRRHLLQPFQLLRRFPGFLPHLQHLPQGINHRNGRPRRFAFAVLTHAGQGIVPVAVVCQH